MKIGICVGVPGTGAGRAEPDMIAAVAELGYDYVEMPLSSLAELDEADFARVRQKLAAENIKCECLNVFIPAKVRLTGEEADKVTINEYINRALERADSLGAGVVVFGSGGARNIPEGYPYEKAFEQLTGAMELVSGVAAGYGIQIAIEALNKGESNIITSLSEADRLVSATGRPNIKILLDYYHFMLESDSTDTLQRLVRENKIIHAHIASPEGRSYPSAVTPEIAKIFGILRDGGYDARCSIEARLENPGAPRAEMEAGLATMRKIASPL